MGISSDGGAARPTYLAYQETARRQTRRTEDRRPEMSKYERRIYFDHLVELRSTYAATEHRPTTMTVDDAVAYAIDLLENPDRLDALLIDEAAGHRSEMPQN
jgi:hypothetical protein